MKIIFICTGNTCRSPMAEVMAQELFRKKNLEVQVISRGIHVFCPSSASNQAVTVMAERGLDLSMHLSRPVCATDLEDADLVLTMTAAHKKVLRSACRSAKIPLYTLKEFTGFSEKDILDPFGQGVEIYEQCAKEIFCCLERLPERI